MPHPHSNADVAALAALGRITQCSHCSEITREAFRAVKKTEEKPEKDCESIKKGLEPIQPAIIRIRLDTTVLEPFQQQPRVASYQQPPSIVLEFLGSVTLQFTNGTAKESLRIQYRRI